MDVVPHSLIRLKSGKLSYITRRIDTMNEAKIHMEDMCQLTLYDRPGLGYVLSPAYDLVASNLVVEGDEEDLVLTLNGKKKKLRKKDFLEAINRFDIEAKAIENMFGRFRNAESHWHEFIDKSFLPDDMKSSFHELLKERIRKIYNS